MKETRVLTADEFRSKAKEMGGGRKAVFVCPNCKTPTTYNDYIDAGLEHDDAVNVLGFSCIGRFQKDKGCNWTLGGLFQIHELEILDEDDGVTLYPHFEFASDEVYKDYWEKRNASQAN